MALTSKQRAFLKKKAHELNPLVRIGKDGVTDSLIQSILEAIDSRELLKVKILQNCEKEKEEVLEEFSKCSEFEVVGIIGRTIILFRENKDKPAISLELKSIR
ncbi:ribosome assembly RNA-binding protein YhbY [Fusobacterium varium]|uniref:ribosome assembly RNA-binding protein YhbY n=1 Tax=Fusobacterium varium TaxID=856 RepID=UPI000BBB5F81|nr:ribosome assembly RNA-binding protein YhbY [uncultured Fusobacterium sp.]BBA50068.1 putative RNA-binding protein [Fusobacterium varium]